MLGGVEVDDEGLKGDEVELLYSSVGVSVFFEEEN